jgi:hypothetical protein
MDCGDLSPLSHFLWRSHFRTDATLPQLKRLRRERKL